MKKLLLAALLVAGCGNGVTASTGAAACATAVACGILPNGVVGISACTQFIQDINEPENALLVHVDADQVNCIASTGNNCDLARACLDYGNPPTACSGSGQMCNGDTWSTCDGLTGTNGNNGTRSFHCAKNQPGASCQMNNNHFDCGFSTCAVGLPSCADSKTVQVCNLGITQHLDCARNNSICVEGGGLLNSAKCRGQGASCTAGDGTPLRCQGNVLVTCADGQEAMHDCGRDNLGCFLVGNSFRCALGNDCDPSNSPAQCNGSVLHYCDKGKRTFVDCGALHFTGCTPNNGGSCTRS
jgi:hypothetical protein